MSSTHNAWRGGLVAAAITAGAALAAPDPGTRPADATGRAWPMFGGGPGRNMVNRVETGLPTSWSVEDGNVRGVKWVAETGGWGFGTPAIAHGKVYLGSNNATPRDPRAPGHRAVLQCLDERTGRFLWQATHEFPNDPVFSETRTLGLLSTPAVDGHRLYYVTPACEVICADAADGTMRWRYDLRKEHGVTPFHANICSPLVVGGRVFVTTGHGLDQNTEKVANPKAPSFVALDWDTGRLLWQSNLPGDRIIEGQWGSPAYAEAGGQPQVIFPGGDGWLYSFEPTTGKLLWKCDGEPQRSGKKDRAIDNYLVATPVVVGDRLYIGTGVYPEHPSPPRASHVLCLDITRGGDVSPRTLKTDDPANRGSALVWAFGGPIVPAPKKGRRARFGPTMSTAAVQDGLVYLSEFNGYLHCLDVATGRRYWEHDLKASVWGSPYWADGKVYLGTDDGQVLVFAHGREKKLLATVDMEESIVSTPAAANGVLFIRTRSKLYAIGPR